MGSRLLKPILGDVPLFDTLFGNVMGLVGFVLLTKLMKFGEIQVEKRS